MDGIHAIGQSPGNNVLATGESAFGDNPFLSLLITQLRNQTPLEPSRHERYFTADR